MKELVLFHKNGDVSMKKLERRISFPENIKYVLLPITEDTFLLHPLAKIIKELFHVSFEATIITESIITHIDRLYMEESETTSQNYKMDRVTKKVSDPIQLYQYLQSIFQTRFYNKISYSNECEIYDHIDFTYFEFELKIDRVEYKHIKMSLESESGPFGVKEIQKKMKFLFSPISLKDGDILIDFHTKRWIVTDQVRKCIVDNNRVLIGVGLPYTQSIMFLNQNQYIQMHQIKGIYAIGVIYNQNTTKESVLDEMIDPISFLTLEGNTGNELVVVEKGYDIWLHEINDIIEFFAYHNYINLTLVMMEDLIHNNALTGNMTEKTYFYIEVFYSNPDVLVLECGIPMEHPYEMVDWFHFLEENTK